MLLGCVVAGTITTHDSSSSAGVGFGHSTPQIGSGSITSHAGVYNDLAGKVQDLAILDAQHNFDSAHDRDCLLEQEVLCDDILGKRYT